MVQIKLSNVIDGIALKLNTKARYSQFSEEYILSNVNVNKEAFLNVIESTLGKEMREWVSQKFLR